MKGKIKVLHLITRLDAGGSSENVILSARAHAADGFEVLVASGPSKNLTEEAAPTGDTRATVVAQYQPVRGEALRPGMRSAPRERSYSLLAARGRFACKVLPALVRPIHPARDLAAFWQIRRLLRTWRPSILHTHSSKAGILGRWAATCSGVPMVVIHTPHGHVFYGYSGRIKSGFYVLLERITAWMTDTLIALSEGEKRESMELGVGTDTQWVVIHSGVRFNGDFESSHAARAKIRRELEIGENEVVIGTVARLEPVKGIGTLIEAASEIVRQANQPVRCLIVGEGEELRSLQQRSRRLEIEEFVHFAGHQSDPPAWMAAMDIYVQPSLNEGMGKTLVMAQALGLPVVASRVCGIPDVVLDGETGLLVPPLDCGRLAHGILRLIEDANLRERLGAAGRKWVQSPDETGFPRFSDKAMVERLKRLYLSASHP